MRIRIQSLVLVLGVCVALCLAGCSSSARSALLDGTDVASMAPKPIARPGLAVDMVKVEGEAELAGAPAPQPVYYRQGGGSPCGTPCGTPCSTPCGLPCESGCGNWHVRAVGGWAFPAGTDSGEGCGYFGADFGRTWPCCWGVDVFYRTFEEEFDREVPVAGAPTFLGTDNGRFNVAGVKATYQHSISNGKLYWYAGVGPVFFWTQDYIADDEGFGGYGELGIGILLNRNWRLRAGVEVMGLNTSAGRLSPTDDSSTRLLWNIAPVAQVEFSF